MICLEKMSCGEKKAVEKLRDNMRSELPKHMLEEVTLFYRFLKARNFDVDKAQHMLQKHISWRKHFQVDTILEDFTPRPFFEKYLKYSDIGLDKNENMALYLPIGKLNGRDIQKCVQINEYVKHWIWCIEERLSRMKLKEKIRKNAIQLTLILNLEKLTLSNATSKQSLEQCVRLLRIVQDNYPERLNAVYAINTPGYYVFIYSILKSMMPTEMLQKIHIYSHSGWQEKLLEVIHADVLPAFLGGNRTDPNGNPLCTTFVNHSGRIHKMYYLPEDERHFKNRSLVKEIKIPPKRKVEILIYVTQTESEIHWEFLIKNKDIGFGLLHKVTDSEYEDILPIQRYDTIDGVEKGFYKPLSIGTYIIIFDNSYSWMNTKEIDYYVTVLKETL